MSRHLRKRHTMELAPMANIRETDVEDMGNRDRDLGFEGGVDDGFSVPGNPREPPNNGGVPRRSPEPEPDRDGFLPVPTDPSVNIKPDRKPLDVNMYATKKTVAQGMMDLALLTANANQLRYVLEASKYGGLATYHYISVSLISMSIILQLVIGVALIFMGRYNVTHERYAQKADVLNNWVVLGVFLITIINVFISSFAIEPMEGIDPVLLRTVMAESATERLVEN